MKDKPRDEIYQHIGAHCEAIPVEQIPQPQIALGNLSMSRGKKLRECTASISCKC